MDLRLPIGSLFTIFGLLLTLFGLAADHAIYDKSLGINVNLDWGLVMLVFGALMAFFGLRAQRRTALEAATAAAPVWPPPSQ